MLEDLVQVRDERKLIVPDERPLGARVRHDDPVWTGTAVIRLEVAVRRDREREDIILPALPLTLSGVLTPSLLLLRIEMS